MSSESQQAAFLGELQGSLAKVETRIAGLRKTHTTFIYTGTGASALATIVAGVTAAAGPVVGEGPAGWRIACIAAALLSACSGLMMALHQQFTVSERLASAVACAGKLKALNVALTITHRALDEVAKEYEEVIAEYREFLL